MNDYKPNSLPAACGAVALALTALTIGLGVVLPAQIDSGIRTPLPVAAPVTSTPAEGVAISRLRIEVTAPRPAAVPDAWRPVEARAAAQGITPAATNARPSSVRSVAAPERVGYHGAAAPARCPYLINGTVDATS